jgi:hypothetical protein
MCFDGKSVGLTYYSICYHLDRDPLHLPYYSIRARVETTLAEARVETAISSYVGNKVQSIELWQCSPDARFAATLLDVLISQCCYTTRCVKGKS